jgi:tetratricopeptide (TPR) repeat protein
MLLGRTEEAIDALRAAVGIDPDFADAHNNLGFAYLKATRYPEAAVHLERALAIEPENQAARANLKELSAAVQAN